MNRNARIMVIFGLLLMLTISTAMPAALAKGHGGGPGAYWVILYYMCADDSDTHIEQSFLHDIEELESVDHIPSVRSIVMVDRYTNWGTGPGDQNDNTRIYEVFEQHSALMVDCGELNMGDPSSLSYFIDWTIDKYGGVKFALILGGHGRSWEGCIPDAHSNGDQLSMSELRTALLDAQSQTGKTLDIIGFNSCVMQYTEVVYALRDCAEIVVASEEFIWAALRPLSGDYRGGWPFDMIYEDLASNFDATPEEFATIMVDDYATFWITNPYVQCVPPPGVIDVMPTLSAWDTAYNDDMVWSAIDWLAIGLIQNLPTYWTQIENARANSEHFGGDDLIDLRHFVELIEVSGLQMTRALNNGIISTKWYIDNGMIAEWHDTIGPFTHPNAHGVGIFFPNHDGDYDQEYSNLDFSQYGAPNWDVFLRTFYDI